MSPCNPALMALIQWTYNSLQGLLSSPGYCPMSNSDFTVTFSTAAPAPTSWGFAQYMDDSKGATDNDLKYGFLHFPKLYLIELWPMSECYSFVCQSSHHGTSC